MRKIIYVICIIIGSMVITGCTKEEMKLKQDSYTIEYGSTIQNDVKTYLDNTDDFIKKTNLSGIPENETEKEYPAIGEYELTLKNGNQESKVKIIVTDTVAPTFKDAKENYEVEYGKSFDVKNIKAEDLSNIEYTLDDSNVNYKKVGTYDATVTAKDSSGNEAKQNIKIKVKEEKKETTNTSSSSSSSNTNKPSTSTSGSSSSNSNSSGSSSSSSLSSGGNNPSTGSKNEITITQDPNDHYEFDGGYADGYEEFEWPSDWE